MEIVMSKMEILFYGMMRNNNIKSMIFILRKKSR